MKRSEPTPQRHLLFISLAVAILQIAAGVAGVISASTMHDISNEVNSTVATVGSLLNTGIETITEEQVAIPGRISQVAPAKSILATLPPPTEVLIVYCVVSFIGFVLLIGATRMRHKKRDGLYIMRGWAIVALVWTVGPWTGHYESLAVIRFFYVEVSIILAVICGLGAIFVQLFWPIWLLFRLRAP